MSISDSLIKHYAEDPETGKIVPVRFMDANEIKERVELQIANTSEKLRARAINEISKLNGH